MFNRRTGFAALVAGLGQLAAGGAVARKREQNQAVSGEIQVVSTGSVWVEQATAGSQSVFDDGWTPFDQNQAVSSDAQIVSTGPVYLSQATAGEQEADAAYVPDPRSGPCTPGDLRMALDGAEAGKVFVQRLDCTWTEAGPTLCWYFAGVCDAK